MAKFKGKDFFYIAILAAFIILFFMGLDSALVPLLLSTFLAYASLPLVKILEKKGFSRLWASSTVLFVVVFITLTALIIGIPPLFEDLREAVVNSPQYLFAFLEKINAWLAEYGAQVPYDKESLTTFASGYFDQISSDFVQATGNFVKNSLLSVTSLIVIVLNVSLIPIFFFYVVNDCEMFLDFFKDLVPLDWRPRFEQFLNECDQILSGFIRGQLLVCAIMATIYSSGLLIVGLKFGVLIGCLTGIFTFIPYVGFTFGLSAAVITAIAHISDGGSGQLIGVLIVYGIGQIIETYVVTPRIVGNKVGLSAFEAILALIVFGNLLGFVGLFIAIPLGAIAKLVFNYALVEYKKTGFYKDL